MLYGLEHKVMITMFTHDMTKSFNLDLVKQ